MLAKRFLITIWLCLLAAVVVPAQAAGHGVAPAESHAPSQGPEGAAGSGHDEHAEHGHGPQLTMAMSNSDIFKWQFNHSVPYPIALMGEDGHA